MAERREPVIEALVNARGASGGEALGPPEPADAFRERMIERGLEVLVVEVMEEFVAAGFCVRLPAGDGWAWTEAGLTARSLFAAGYHPVRLLPTGEWAGVLDQLYTVGLFVGLDDSGYRTRFCFPDRPSAEAALAAWDGEGFAPGFWIKQKPEDVRNPALADREAGDG